MPDLLAARWLFGLSLAFHIVFAAIGVAMPLFMVLAEWRWRRGGDPSHLELARRWAKGTAILFAVGAVSGTVISFELGLLWPRFMELAGPVVGLPFALEGFAFFAEAIFLGIYLYGWERVGPGLHLASGVVVAASGAVSAFFVTLANAWMAVPAGFDLEAGRVVAVSPLEAMFPPGWAHEVLHVLLSCYAATGFAVAGLHAAALLRHRGTSSPAPSSEARQGPTPGSRAPGALRRWLARLSRGEDGLLRDRRTSSTDRAIAFHRAALRIALGVGGAAALALPLSGDLSAREVAATQPLKLAALEGQFRTERGAPLRIGGLPDVERAETRFALEIPRGLSLLAFHDPGAEVKGLEAFPRETWPPVAKVHLAFQVMVGLGTLLAALAALHLVHLLRGGEYPRYLLRGVALSTPLGFVALEAGWLVTEWGRQPYAVSGVLRTADAVTPVEGLAVPLVAFALLYLFLAAVVVRLMRRQVAGAPRGPEEGSAAGGGGRR
jgi:cytochrome d ubiquinol oxidase subunit I